MKNHCDNNASGSVVLRRFEHGRKLLNSLLLTLRFLVSLFVGSAFFLLLIGQEILTREHLVVLVSELLLGRERSVFLLDRDVLRLLALDVLFLELREETGPVFRGKIGILAELALDHEFFNVVDRVHIVHRVDDDFSDDLEISEMTHGRDSVALDQNVAIRQQLESLERFAVRSDQTLAPLDKFLFITNKSTDFDNLYKHLVVFHNFDRFREGYRPSQQFDEVAGSDDRIRVPCLTRGFYGEGAFD